MRKTKMAGLFMVVGCMMILIAGSIRSSINTDNPNNVVEAKTKQVWMVTFFPSNDTSNPIEVLCEKKPEKATYSDVIYVTELDTGTKHWFSGSYHVTQIEKKE